MGSNTDFTFFTNEPGQTLLERFKVIIKDAQLFDVLVGYFRSSGFRQLYETLETVDKTRILIGMSIDRESYQALDTSRKQTAFDYDSHQNTEEAFQKSLIKDIEQSHEPGDELETALGKFIEFLTTDCANPEEDRRNGGNGRKLELRAHPSRRIHAKVYIGRYPKEDRDYGFVVTGSSNFSHSGLEGNREFNVELNKSYDVKFALDQFNKLWVEGVDVSETFIDGVNKKTWLNDHITPYQLYLKLIYEYLQEDINLQDDFEAFLPEGFMHLQYQEQAVQQAIKKLKEHNGVFIADVVGLGKTFITAQLLQQVKGRILVICPPMLKEYWEESLHLFRVPALVESLGKLESIFTLGADRFDYVVVDEAHRFRNENTQSYTDLLDICRGKKVILVTATPLNNTIEDIYAQLKLFQIPKKSTIPGIPNLENYFNLLKKRFAGLERSSPEYAMVIDDVSQEIRENILKHVMVRRTRSDVIKYFSQDMEKQNLSFPQVTDPQRIIYRFQGELETTFNKTTQLLLKFNYARYTPLLYYCGKTKLTEFEQQQQRNVGGFMKGLLIKRLESSFYAFRKSIGRFIESYRAFIKMFQTGNVYISQNVDVFELLENDDPKTLETLDKLVEEEKARVYRSTDFRQDFLKDLEQDLEILEEIHTLWLHVTEDPKIDALLSQLNKDQNLKAQRLILFTESKETGDYLFGQLNRHFPDKVMFFSSQGGILGQPPVVHGPQIARQFIDAAFNPSHQAPSEKPLILVSTDVLSEGVNLHRANVVINYDLPWNPTRVLQRVGRINRIGSTFSDIFVYNFFPTTQSDEHLGLETNITNKIQLFHNLLGEDARYLSDGESIGSQELFDTLSNKQTYAGEEEGDSELEYLEMMRNLRDEDPKLFEKIKRLPKKARSGRLVAHLSKDQLVTFFRIGHLKKFYLHTGELSEEITFFKAAQLLQCTPDTPRQRVPAQYHQYLNRNKEQFAADVEDDQRQQEHATSGSSSNLNHIERRLRDRNFRNHPQFTDLDKDYLAMVRKRIRYSDISRKTARMIKRDFEKTMDPLEMINILRKHIRVKEYSVPHVGGGPGGVKGEIILSGYQVTGVEG